MVSDLQCPICARAVHPGHYRHHIVNCTGGIPSLGDHAIECLQNQLRKSMEEGKMMNRAPEKMPQDHSMYDSVDLDNACKQYMPIWKILDAILESGTQIEECFICYGDQGLGLYYPRRSNPVVLGDFKCGRAGCPYDMKDIPPTSVGWSEEGDALCPGCGEIGEFELHSDR